MLHAHMYISAALLQLMLPDACLVPRSVHSMRWQSIEIPLKFKSYQAKLGHVDHFWCMHGFCFAMPLHCMHSANSDEQLRNKILRQPIRQAAEDLHVFHKGR